MTGRPTITHVARAAQVSSATVDRVLNRRPGVRPPTVSRVLDAAVALGYLRREDIEALRTEPPVRIAFLLPRGGNPYLNHLNARARAITAEGQAHARVQSFFIQGFSPEALARALHRYGARADAVVFMAIDHPLVRDTTAGLMQAGKTVVTTISDLPTTARHAFVGIDSFSAGRTAAQLLCRFTPPPRGSFALIAASRAYRAHLEREMGFLSLIEERYPGMRVVAAAEGHDNRDENYQHTRRLLAEHPDLSGIYNVGGASDGIGRALRDAGSAGRISFIGHGLTPDTRAMLINGTMDAVLTQSPDSIIRKAIFVAKDITRGADSTLPIEIYLAENLPATATPHYGSETVVGERR